MTIRAPKDTPVVGAVGECALAGSRVRTRRPESAHSQARKCALIFHPLHRYAQGGWEAPTADTRNAVTNWPDVYTKKHELRGRFLPFRHAKSENNNYYFVV